MKPYQRRLQRKLKEENGKRVAAQRKMFRMKLQRNELVNIMENILTEEQLDTTVNGEFTIRHIITLIKPQEVQDEIVPE